MERLKKALLVLGLLLLLVGIFFVVKSFMDEAEGRVDLCEKRIASLVKPEKPNIKNWSEQMVTVEPGRVAAIEFTYPQKCIDGIWSLDDSSEYGKPNVIITYVDAEKKQKSLRIDAEVKGFSEKDVNDVYGIKIYAEEDPSSRLKPLKGTFSFTVPENILTHRKADLLFSASVIVLELYRGEFATVNEGGQVKRIFNFGKRKILLGIEREIYVVSSQEAQQIADYKNSLEFYDRRVRDIRKNSEMKLKESEYFRRTGMLIIMISLLILLLSLVGGKGRKP